jgi:hypothetical protein
MKQFWWGHKENNSKIHWMSWKRMGVSKAKGGLGFRDLVVFNKGLLAKQVWRLHQQPESLVGQICKAKYYPNCTVLEATRGKKPSLVWRSLTATQEVIIRGAMWHVGDGKSFKVWGDSWVPLPTTFKIQSPCINLPASISQKVHWWQTLLTTKKRGGMCNLSIPPSMSMKRR